MYYISGITNYLQPDIPDICTAYLKALLICSLTYYYMYCLSDITPYLQPNTPIIYTTHLTSLLFCSLIYPLLVYKLLIWHQNFSTAWHTYYIYCLSDITVYLQPDIPITYFAYQLSQLLCSLTYILHILCVLCSLTDLLHTLLVWHLNSAAW